MTTREKGIKALSTIFRKKSNIKIIEKLIHSVAKNETDYKAIIYQTVINFHNSHKIKDVYREIKMRKILWKHKTLKKIADDMIEQNDFIENPFEIEEGIHLCFKCGSRRVFSYNKQVRGSDEGTSVFCECVACHAKWNESG